MKTNTTHRRPGFTLVELLVVIVIIAALAGLTAPQLIRMRKKGDQVVAMNNGKQLYLTLNDFSTEYGSFPDGETAKQVITNTGTTMSLTGDTSNDYFRQTIAANIAKAETPFYSKVSGAPKTPDNNMKGAEALKAGEVGFSYMMNGTTSPATALSNEDPNRVIACTPVANAAKGEFDPEPLDKKAAFVYLDSSVQMKDIREDKKVAMGKKTLLDNGAETLWGAEIKPVIKAPKKK